MTPSAPSQRPSAIARRPLEVIAGHDRNDPRSSRIPVGDYSRIGQRGVRGLKIGILKELMAAPFLQDEVRDLVSDVATAFNTLGANVTTVSIPQTMDGDEELAVAAAEVTSDAGLILIALASSCYERACRKRGAHVAAEGCADRAYNANGTLVSRKMPGALITDPHRAAEQAVRMALEGKVRSIDVAKGVARRAAGGRASGRPVRRLSPRRRRAALLR